MFLFEGRCTVELRSWGNYDAVDEQHGYVKVNQRVISADITRGITVTTFQCLPSCDPENLKTYDTNINTSNAIQLRDWLASLEDGLIVVGVSADEAINRIDPARAILTSLGVDITGLGYRWRLAFVTQVGRPHLSKVMMEPAGDPALLTTKIRM